MRGGGGARRDRGGGAGRARLRAAAGSRGDRNEGGEWLDAGGVLLQVETVLLPVAGGRGDRAGPGGRRLRDGGEGLGVARRGGVGVAVAAGEAGEASAGGVGWTAGEASARGAACGGGVGAGPAGGRLAWTWVGTRSGGGAWLTPWRGGWS
ncbi:MAG: hypothetical protein ACR2PL_06475 [Dehalococcoidia bacterium]